MPTFKIFLATNHRPNVVGTDEGIWRRLKLIPFEVTIPSHERDPNLLNKLLEELPGILAWAVEGCLRWQSTSCILQDPEEVLVATRAYQRDNDILADFLEECCEVAKDNRAKVKDVYDAYCKFCSSVNVKPLGKQDFNTKLRERGFTDKKSGQMFWHGISLKSSEDDELPDFMSM